jgi:hypothetical protein
MFCFLPSNRRDWGRLIERYALARTMARRVDDRGGLHPVERLKSSPMHM